TRARRHDAAPFPAERPAAARRALIDIFALSFARSLATGNRMSDSNIPAEPTLTGARVQLRPLRASDADDLFEVHSDPRVMRYWSHAPWTGREQASARIAQLAHDRENA